MEVEEDFVQDDFNLTGLQTQVAMYKEALEVCCRPSTSFRKVVYWHRPGGSTEGTTTSERKAYFWLTPRVSRPTSADMLFDNLGASVGQKTWWIEANQREG